jgi:UDP-N-acetylglucosamine 2-epimerase (non-hydrolysing)
MIDSVQYSKSSTRSNEDILKADGLAPELLLQSVGYGLVTLHRPSNVDDPVVLKNLLSVLAEVAKSLPLVLVLHPRTRSKLLRFDLLHMIDPTCMVVLPAQGYLDMLGLLSRAKVVLTDSGGLQEETTALGVPCLTLRQTTERPITMEQGTNTLVGVDRRMILASVKAILKGEGKQGRMPELWDGHAAERITADLYKWLCLTPASRVSKTAS